MPRPRIVDFEGRQIPKSQLPNGSLFIEGVWYSSVDTLPPELKNDPDIVAMFKQSKKRKAALNSNGTAIPKNKPAIDDLSVADLLSELKRIEYSERQFRGFYRCFWDRQAEVNVRDDRSKAEFVRKYAKIFGLTYTSLDEIHEANLSLKEKKPV